MAILRRRRLQGISCTVSMEDAKAMAIVGKARKTAARLLWETV